MADFDGTRGVPVLLLKTKSTPHDSYLDLFLNAENSRFQPIFVPVLEHKFNDESFRSIKALVEAGSLVATNQGTEKSYGGIIFTSQRAVEFFTKVVGEVRTSGCDVEKLLPADLPLYAVGPATARGLRALDLPCPILGEETGSGEVLSPFILEDYNGRVQGLSKRPLLFLVGEKRGDIIPKALQDPSLSVDRRCQLDEVVVYKTKEMESFRSDFSALCHEHSANGVSMQWVVVFSPTGCHAMLDGLGLLNESGKCNPDIPSKMSSLGMRTLIATIGPTTRDYLLKEFNFEPHVSALKPSPDGVGEAIIEYIQKQDVFGG
ncbi:uroporphyrinogen-III synthase-like protein [Eremomyces bilateralis CBS 781.70]|uniref:Uroporphyrinogen-III synthase-like protein n=1 Tax=Eremomyces bilateralis CBS 781.70 TaxID=1392243 RepID=A0A6G1GE90_9PEZI|nr:uroporphyrinogen-III synthase-like protein [Eremomyces bilateralis CBS 781.70]KAF1816211.1 uroporphyrinogen-III synthase-like protein [Eremomyces bilateralis CBS 781.70]